MQDMKDVFYIIKIREDLYQVRMTFNYECIATAKSLEEALGVITKLTERYVNEDTLKMAWRSSDIRPSKPDQTAHNKKIYEDRGHEFEDDINNLFEAQKPKLLKKKVNTLVTKSAPKVTKKLEREEPKVEEVKPKLLKVKRKPLTFK